MATEIVLVPYVYLKPPHLQKSGHHTAWAPAPVMPDTQPGAVQATISLEFWHGVATDVPMTTYRIFAAQGIATTERPLSPWEQRHGVQP